MYGNKSKNLERYQKSEGAYNTVKTGNQIISGILRELERSMIIVADSIERTKDWKPEKKDLDLKRAPIWPACSISSMFIPPGFSFLPK